MTSILDKMTEATAVRTLLDSIDGSHQTMIDDVIAWSKVNSGSRNLDGLEKMQTIILEAFEPLGATVSLEALAPSDAINENGERVALENGNCIRLIKNPEANRRVLLTGHTDTVFPADSPFQKPAWLDENTLNGPGVADMKGGIIVMLNALKAFEAGPYAGKIGWEVILSPDEETGSLRSGPLLMERAKTADIGLTYEPALADGTLAGARKGSGNYTLVVRGRAAHAGREFHQGRNAVVALSQIIGELASLTDGRPDLTVNCAVIKGGVAPNVVPDMAWCRFNVRLQEVEHGDWFEAKLAEIIQAWQAREGYELMLQGGINRPPKILSDANLKMMDIIAACGHDLGLSINYVPTGGCCEGNNLAAAGLPNVDTLGVRGGAIHSAQEFVLVDSFVERTKLSTLILCAFADGLLDAAVKAKEATD